MLKEVDHLAKAKLDLQCQAAKDCSTLNAQMKILEMELEEQINKNQKMTMMSLEVTDLRQQIQALERQLKNQRDFMDVRKLDALPVVLVSKTSITYQLKLMSLFSHSC